MRVTSRRSSVHRASSRRWSCEVAASMIRSSQKCGRVRAELFARHGNDISALVRHAQELERTLNRPCVRYPPRPVVRPGGEPAATEARGYSPPPAAKVVRPALIASAAAFRAEGAIVARARPFGRRRPPVRRTRPAPTGRGARRPPASRAGPSSDGVKRADPCSPTARGSASTRRTTATWSGCSTSRRSKTRSGTTVLTGYFNAGALALAARGIEGLVRNAATCVSWSAAPCRRPRSRRLKVTASKGRIRTGASSLTVASGAHFPLRSSNASRARSAGSTSHRCPTPAFA